MTKSWAGEGMTFFLRSLVKGYRLCLSPLLGPACRFYPSCSQYALICLDRFPWPLALWFVVKRLFRCHPFCEGGEDDPPEVIVDISIKENLRKGSLSYEHR